MIDTDTPAPPKTPRKRIWTSIFLGLCATFGVVVGVHASSVPNAPPTSVSADSGWTPANGYRVNGKCYAVIGAGGLSVEQNCNDWNPVPKSVKECAIGTLVAGVGAFFTRNPAPAAMGTTVASCAAVIGLAS